MLILGARYGFKNGLTKSISHLVALVVTVMALLLILMLTASIQIEHTRNSVLSVIALVILGTVYGIVKFLLKSAHKISELPILHQLDKCAGVLIGLLWVIIIYMVIISLSFRGMLGGFGTMVVNDVQSNALLTLINSYNILMPA